MSAVAPRIVVERHALVRSPVRDLRIAACDDRSRHRLRFAAALDELLDAQAAYVDRQRPRPTQKHYLRPGLETRSGKRHAEKPAGYRFEYGDLVLRDPIAMKYDDMVPYVVKPGGQNGLDRTQGWLMRQTGVELDGDGVAVRTELYNRYKLGRAREGELEQWSTQVSHLALPSRAQFKRPVGEVAAARTASSSANGATLPPPLAHLRAQFSGADAVPAAVAPTMIAPNVLEVRRGPETSNVELREALCHGKRAVVSTLQPVVDRRTDPGCIACFRGALVPYAEVPKIRPGTENRGAHYKLEQISAMKFGLKLSPEQLRQMRQRERQHKEQLFARQNERAERQKRDAASASDQKGRGAAHRKSGTRPTFAIERRRRAVQRRNERAVQRERAHARRVAIEHAATQRLLDKRRKWAERVASLEVGKGVDEESVAEVGRRLGGGGGGGVLEEPYLGMRRMPRVEVDELRRAEQSRLEQMEQSKAEEVRSTLQGLDAFDEGRRKEEHRAELRRRSNLLKLQRGGDAARSLVLSKKRAAEKKTIGGLGARLMGNKSMHQFRAAGIQQMREERSAPNL